MERHIVELQFENLVMANAIWRRIETKYASIHSSICVDWCRVVVSICNDTIPHWFWQCKKDIVIGWREPWQTMGHRNFRIIVRFQSNHVAEKNLKILKIWKIEYRNNYIYIYFSFLIYFTENFPILHLTSNFFTQFYRNDSESSKLMLNN